LMANRAAVGKRQGKLAGAAADARLGMLRAKSSGSEVGRRVSAIARRPSALLMKSSSAVGRRDAATAEVGRLATLFLANAGVKLDLMEEVTALAPVRQERLGAKKGEKVKAVERVKAAPYVRRQVEEERRWANVEDGTSDGWRSCAVCGFLSWAEAERCESCAMRLPTWDRHAASAADGAVDGGAGDAEEEELAEELRVYCVRDEPMTSMRALRGVQRIEKMVMRAPRSELERLMFEGLDRNGAGALGCRSMLTFAKICGFDGEEDAWEREYAEICQTFGIDIDEGVDFETFAWLTRQQNFKGNCTDDELREMLLEDCADMARFARRCEFEWDVSPVPSALDLLRRCSLQSRRTSSSASRERRSSWVASSPDSRGSGSRGSRRGSGRTSRRSSYRYSLRSPRRSSSDSALTETEEEEGDERAGHGESEESSEVEEDDEDENCSEDCDCERPSSEGSAEGEGVEGDELAAVALEHQAESLDESPPEGTTIEVFCDDGLWHLARIAANHGMRAAVVYLDDQAEDELDFSMELARLADRSLSIDMGFKRRSKMRSRRESTVSEASEAPLAIAMSDV